MKHEARGARHQAWEGVVMEDLVEAEAQESQEGHTVCRLKAQEDLAPCVRGNTSVMHLLTTFSRSSGVAPCPYHGACTPNGRHALQRAWGTRAIMVTAGEGGAS